MIGIGSNDRGGAGHSDRLRGRPETSGTQGGLVTETGVALVEQGEMIVPAPGSRAQVELARADAGTEVHIHLPVVVEVVGRSDERELERTVDETLRRLRIAIEAHPTGA